MHKLTQFDNGLKLVTKKIDFVRSISIGIFVGAGSAYETENRNGISHFIEHMLFKGTKNMTAFDIADAIDRIGGQINAFTSKELTCFYTKSTDEHLEKCLNVLSDMFFDSQFYEEEMTKEKKVVIEEISMIEDSPEDVCHELLSKIFYNGSSLARPIIGSPDNVNSFTKGDIKDYMANFYCPSNTVIAVTGNFDESKVIDLVKEYFAANFKNSSDFVFTPAKRHIPKQAYSCKVKKIEQSSIAIGFPCVPFNSPKAYSLMLFSAVLGGGMSSRLFQKIREELGLAYSVYTYPSTYINNGMFTVYLGTNPQNIETAVKTIFDELKIIKKQGITKDEFLRGKEQLKGNFILGQENTTSIMNVYGKLMLLSGELFDLDDRLDRINKITLDQIQDIIEETLNFEQFSISCVSSKKQGSLLKLAE